MSSPIQDTPNVVDVLVELSGSAVQRHWNQIDEQGTRLFEPELLKYLRDLVESLELPISFRLTFEKEASRPVEVRIDGRQCPLPLMMPDFTTGTALVRFIANAITEDRENLVSERLVEHLWPTLSPEDKGAGDRLDPVRLRELMRAAVRRGLSFSCLRGALRKTFDVSAGFVTRDFEEALRDPTQLRLEIVLGSDHVQAISAVANEEQALLSCEKLLASPLNALRRGLFDELGIILPKVKVRRDTILPNEVRFRLNDLMLPPREGNKAGGVQFIVESLGQAIRDHAELFLTTYCIDNLRTSSPELVAAACQKIGTPTLLRILEGLLMEGLSIRDLRGICEGILAIDSVSTVDQNKFIVFFPPVSNICPVRQEKPLEALDDNDYLTCVRMSMKGWFSANYAPDGLLPVYLLDQQLEQRLASVEPLNEDERDELFKALQQEIASDRRRSPILTSADVRRPLWKLMEREFGRYPVLSYSELSPDLNIDPIARIVV